MPKLGCDPVVLDAPHVQGPGFNPEPCQQQSPKRAQQSKKGLQSLISGQLVALTPDNQGTGTLLSPGIKTPASPGTHLGFRATLAVHKLIPAESTFCSGGIKSLILVPPQGSRKLRRNRGLGFQQGKGEGPRYLVSKQ